MNEGCWKIKKEILQWERRASSGNKVTFIKLMLLMIKMVESQENIRIKYCWSEIHVSNSPNSLNILYIHFPFFWSKLTYSPRFLSMWSLIQKCWKLLTPLYKLDFNPQIKTTFPFVTINETTDYYRLFGTFGASFK